MGDRGVNESVDGQSRQGSGHRLDAQLIVTSLIPTVRHLAACTEEQGLCLPLIAMALPPCTHCLLQLGLIMRNTSSSFPPPKREAVPYAESPLFKAPGKVDSCLSFRPQGKCHLPGESSLTITPGLFSITSDRLFPPVQSPEAALLLHLLIVPLDFKMQKDWIQLWLSLLGLNTWDMLLA